MAKDDYYTFKTVQGSPNDFTCIAVDKDYEVQKRYNITGSTCDCWAGLKWCRHKQMLVKFKAEKLIDSNKYWNHDKSIWLPQAQGGEQ
jgi:hypothetical protein